MQTQSDFGGTHAGQANSQARPQLNRLAQTLYGEMAGQAELEFRPHRRSLGVAKQNKHKERPESMKKITKLTCAAAAALAVCLMFQTPICLFGDESAQSADGQGGNGDQPMRIMFNKCQTSPGILQGTVEGDCDPGTIYFQQLPGTVVGAEVVRFAGEYTISTAQCSFKAVCAGIRVVSTGKITLTGVVIEASQGPDVGDRVRVDAQLLIEQGVRCSAGTMTVTPFHSDQD